MLFTCCQSKSETDMLKERTEEMKKQINNIYEILEFLTNESKKKLNLNESNDDEQKDITTIKQYNKIFYSKTRGTTEKQIRREKKTAKEYEQIKKLVEESVEENTIKKFSV